MSMNEKLVVELSDTEVQYAITWWLKEKYKSDPRGVFNVAGNVALVTDIRELGQGRIEPRFKYAEAIIWFTEKPKDKGIK